MPLLVDAKSLAQTYDHPSKDPWTAVELYREAAAKPDDWGSQRVSSAINSDQSNEFEGISRSEVRAWVDNGSMPDAARAIETTRNLGWNAEEWTDTVQALAKLVIGIYTFGSIIRRNYSPSWSPDDDISETVIKDALTQVGVGFQEITRVERRQGDEIRPKSHATQLGRALVVAGAPVGNKNSRSVGKLPEWVKSAPRELKRDLALLFARGRGSQRHGKATLAIQVDRPLRYFEDVAQLIEDVTDEKVTASEHGVTISAGAVRKLKLA